MVPSSWQASQAIQFNRCGLVVVCVCIVPAKSSTLLSHTFMPKLPVLILSPAACFSRVGLLACITRSCNS